MKRLLTISLLTLCCTSLVKAQQGVPFMRNYTAQEYGAHNHNFNIICGENGCVFIANFEGLLYYDQSTWNVVHTDNFYRLTALFRDKNGRIWVGGYNYIGYVDYDEKGKMRIENLMSQEKIPFNGQVEKIWQDAGGSVCVETSDHSVYSVREKSLIPAGALPPEEHSIQLGAEYDINKLLKINSDLYVAALAGRGLLVTDSRGRKLYQLTEESGLCNNNVTDIAYDPHGLLWGVTDNGIFSVSIPSMYSRFTSSEGLRGEVLSIQTLGEELFVGTLEGLFRRMGQVFVPVSGMKHACWSIEPDGNSLLAATTGGVFRVYADGSTQHLSTASTTTVLADDGGFYSGEMDGLFYYKGGFRSEVANAEKVVRMFKVANGDIWMQNLYGDLWLKPSGEKNFYLKEIEKYEKDINALIHDNNEVLAVNIDGVWRWNGHDLVWAGERMKKLILYPSCAYTDFEGNMWLTDTEGYGLYVVNNGEYVQDHAAYIAPLNNYAIRSVLRTESQLWVGGDFGLIGVKKNAADPMFSHKPQLFLRSITIHGDSTVWGGYGEQPGNIGNFNHDDGELRINYAIDYSPLIGNSTYRFRLNGGEWSDRGYLTHLRFLNMAPGFYVLEIQARDPMGRLSNIISVRFGIAPPFYLRWYMLLLYAVLAIIIIYLIVRWRMHRLQHDKLRLEKTVRERTAEVVKQKNEIEEKSKSLQQALNDLSHAQHELIRQEKMATMGKLTQGLIDRILNPMNYINNFSKLSKGLIKDVKANIEDEKGNMNQDNYEDTVDVLNMLEQNLDKVEQHGINTSRTLKAMEDILKYRTISKEPMNIAVVLQKNYEMLGQYYQKEIEEKNIRMTFDCPSDNIIINGNADLLSKTIMNLLGNGVYAVCRKCIQDIIEDYHPEIGISATVTGKTVVIKVRDNGIGISENIIGKIFDPFFTTKTTSEASGVGLYLSHEIVQNCGGTITVKSEKNLFTEFEIVIPLLENQ